MEKFSQSPSSSSRRESDPSVISSVLRDIRHANRLNGFGKRPTAMQFQPVFGKTILLGVSICSLLTGCALHGPMGCAPEGIAGGCLSCHPRGAEWEDPSSPDWPAACMPEGVGANRSKQHPCLLRHLSGETPPDAPPYPRFHPLPTRPMFSPAADSWPVSTEPPAAFGTLPAAISADGVDR